MPDVPPFADFVARIRAGDDRAAADLVRQYEPFIRREVRLNLRDRRLGRVFDSMDVCQSVLASFFVHTAAGAYDLDDPEQLLALLVTMARYKLASAARGEYRQQRDARRVTPDGDAVDRAAGTGPTPSREVAGRELLHQFRARLTDEERAVADLRADGLPWADVAARLGGTAQARRMQLVRAVERVERELGDRVMTEPIDLADTLESLWQRGDRPDLAAFVAAAGDLAPRRLADLVAIDRRERRRTGERIPAEDYFHRFPALLADPDLALDLVYGELLLDEEHGRPADEGAAARRFPDLAESLRIQLDLHRALTPTRPDAPADTLPRQFGRYEIERTLGRGGMGTVYLARDTQLGRKVALKVSNLADDPGPQFAREARAAAALRHPGICPVYDFGEIDGRHFLTMAYLEGGTLAERLEGGPFPVAEAVRLVRTLTDALATAHAAGIIHRDLKPANILFDQAGPPVVTDFGLARHVSPTTTEVSLFSHIVGTPAYMAPEQVTGETRAIGPATDVYALGVVLYELLTGRRPFDGPLYSVLARIPTEDPPAPPGVDARLSAICAKALAKRPADRFPSMTAFAAALDVWAAGIPATHRRWVHRLVPALGIALLALVGVLAWKPWKGSPETAGPTPEVQRDPAAARRLADRAWALNDSDRMDEAIAECSAALRLDDECVPALLCRANAYIKKRDFDPAVADLDRACEIEPKNDMPHVDLAWAYNAMGSPDKALRSADRAIELNQNSEEAYAQRGEARVGLRDFRGAVADLTVAIGKNDRTPWVYRQRAIAYEALGEPARAAEDRRTADRLEGQRSKP